MPQRPLKEYIGLGDSISSDDFPGKGKGVTSLLHKNTLDFPEFSGRDLSTYYPNATVRNLTVDGLTSQGLLEVVQQHYKPPFSDEVLVTLTIGGNDILQFIQDTTKNPNAVAQGVQDNIERVLNMFRKRVVEKSKGELSFVLGTMYDPLKQVKLGKAGPQQKTIDQALRLMHDINDRIRRFEDTTVVSIADVHQHFEKSADLSWYIFPYEPSQVGASEVRRVFWDKIEEVLEIPHQEGSPSFFQQPESASSGSFDEDTTKENTSESDVHDPDVLLEKALKHFSRERTSASTAIIPYVEPPKALMITENNTNKPVKKQSE